MSNFFFTISQNSAIIPSYEKAEKVNVLQKLTKKFCEEKIKSFI